MGGKRSYLNAISIYIRGHKAMILKPNFIEQTIRIVGAIPEIANKNPH